MRLRLRNGLTIVIYSDLIHTWIMDVKILEREPYPWFLFKKGEDGRNQLFFKKQMIRRVDTVTVTRSEAGAKHKFLHLSSPPGRCCLWNPVTRESIRLPSLDLKPGRNINSCICHRLQTEQSTTGGDIKGVCQSHLLHYETVRHSFYSWQTATALLGFDGFARRYYYRTILHSPRVMTPEGEHVFVRRNAPRQPTQDPCSDVQAQMHDVNDHLHSIKANITEVISYLRPSHGRGRGRGRQ
ncbi:hypothetical protein F3Y22_tig00110893pilonHSYRG01291 [Hibiscus syriacus]|uniref:Uncharacterized protein n=1 Tax=Hibiscus syriacus TaxID=106335 RepID=A0A6A2ZHR7_HIBSY|nr:hypothetical protein F3Y22_tig00110893pilonHSYRG01291 [Hibiscus syriacus]